MAKKKSKKRKTKKRATPVEMAERRLRALKHIADADQSVKHAKEVLHGPKAAETALTSAAKALARATKRIC